MRIWKILISRSIENLHPSIWSHFTSAKASIMAASALIDRFPLKNWRVDTQKSWDLETETPIYLGVSLSNFTKCTVYPSCWKSCEEPPKLVHVNVRDPRPNNHCHTWRLDCVQNSTWGGVWVYHKIKKSPTRNGVFQWNIRGGNQ